jgi:FkbM family methyltransferase
MYILRNSIARISRSIPYFYGKFRLGKTISHLLSSYEQDGECIETVKMKDGHLMQIDIRSRTEAWSYWTGEYDDDIISKLSTCLKKDFVALDIGANIGFYSIAWGHKLKSLDGLIYAFEPVKTNFNRLVNNISLNGLEEVVLPFDIALGDREGTIEMSMESSNNSQTGNAVMVMGEISSDYFERNNTARLTTLDLFAEEQKIKKCHLIKIDVEGAEVLFLQGSKIFINRHRPIIYGEFNSYFLTQFGQSFIDVVGIVASWSYRFFKQTKTGSFTEVTKPDVGLENVLLVPSETTDSMLAQLGVQD